MMRTSIIFLVFFILNASVNGQEIKARIPRQELSDLYKSLNSQIKDSSKIENLLQLADYYTLKQGNIKLNIDTAKGFIQKANGLNIRGKSRKYSGYTMLVESRIDRINGHAKEAELKANNSIKLLQLPNDGYYLALACIEICYYYKPTNPLELVQLNHFLDKALLLTGQLKSHSQRAYCVQSLQQYYQSILYSRIALEIKLKCLMHLLSGFQQVKVGEGEMWARKEIADIHLQQGKTAVAEDELLSLIKDQKAGNYPHISFSHDLLVSVLIYEAKYTKALYHALESIKSVSLPLDSLYLSDFYRKPSLIYEYLHNRDESIKWERIRLNYMVSKKQTDDIYSGIKRIVEDEIKKGRPNQALNFVLYYKRKFPPQNLEEKKYMAMTMGVCFAAINRNDLAEKYFLDMIRTVEIQKQKKELAYDLAADQYMGRFYLNTKQYSKAKKYLDKTLAEWLIGANASRELFKNEFMFKLDSAAGNYLAAIDDMKRSKIINDSIFNASKSKQIEELRINYDSEQKEISIKLLNEKQKVQQIKLQHTENTRNWIIGGASLLLLLLGFSYSQFLLKQRSNRAVTHQNAVLKQLVKEKDWLLKEVHHRVKNNLHTVMCLLESQAAYLENDALRAIENSQHRIYAMSLIHQKLYLADDVKTVNMSTYLSEFINYLKESFGNSGKIHFYLDIDPVELGVSQAIPLALIINEAVTNSLKHAFPHNRIGEIRIWMHQESEIIKLIIADNGIGIIKEMNDKQQASLGLKLMHGLVEDIHGSIDIENDNGTKIIIVFNFNPLHDNDHSATGIKPNEFEYSD